MTPRRQAKWARVYDATTLSCAITAALFFTACRTTTLPTPDSPGIPLAPAESLGFDSAALAGVAAYVASEVDSAYPGAVVAVGRHGRLALLAATGYYGVDDRRRVTPTTIYDLASLTKVVGLTTACILLVEEGKLDLSARVRAYLPEFRGSNRDRVTIRHLLTHSSGLPAWRPLFKETTTRATALALIDTTALLHRPGEMTVYSDLGAVVLTQVVERITGERLDRYLDSMVFQPLGMTATRYLPPPKWRDRIAPTERDTLFRLRALRGEVHDENAGRLDGVSGHAGLFSHAVDLSRFASWLLVARRCSRLGDSPPPLGPGTIRWTSPATACVLVQNFTTKQNIVPASSRALGWDTPSEGSSAGTKLGLHAFGHTGFTGTSIWLDPDKDLFIILLSNRVHPTRANTRIQRVRPRVADLVVDALVHPER